MPYHPDTPRAHQIVTSHASSHPGQAAPPPGTHRHQSQNPRKSPISCRFRRHCRVVQQGGLSQAEARRLHATNQVILRAAAGRGGTSFAGYVNEARGRQGYLGQAHVFRRQRLPCKVCGTPIIRTTVAGRAANICPRCQQR